MSPQRKPTAKAGVKKPVDKTSKKKARPGNAAAVIAALDELKENPIRRAW